MCYWPTLIRNRHYVANKKNGGVIPAISDERQLYTPIGCGECEECRKQRQNGWITRMMEEIKKNPNGKFITLTFSNEWYTKLREEVLREGNKELRKIRKSKRMKIIDKERERRKIENRMTGYGLDNEIATIATRKFLERWRYRYGNMADMRHWLVTELGHNGTENIHMHGILWSKQSHEIIRDEWKYGYIYPRSDEEARKNYVGDRTVRYVVKYVSKIDTDHKTYRSKILVSPGIGKAYTDSVEAMMNRYDGEETRETYIMKDGRETSLPIYYRNKIYTDEERRKLWSMKLDRQIRYVNGIEIDISKGMTEYFRVLQYERERSIAMGYQRNSKNWELIEYEKQHREMMQARRLTGG